MPVVFHLMAAVLFEFPTFVRPYILIDEFMGDSFAIKCHRAGNLHGRLLVSFEVFQRFPNDYRILFAVARRTTTALF